VQVYDVTDEGLREIKAITREARNDLLTREHKAPFPQLGYTTIPGRLGFRRLLRARHGRFAMGQRFV